MSKYTTEVRFIVEQMNGYKESQERGSINEMVNNVSSEIIGEYPLFDEAYRQTLNNKIIKHFYTREIGYETVGLWRFKLNTKMNEIMPYYNQLYESELIEFDPLLDFHYTKEGVNNEEEESQSHGSTVSSGNKSYNESADGAENEAKNTNKNEKSKADGSGIENTQQTGVTEDNANETGLSNNNTDSKHNEQTRGTSQGTDSNRDVNAYSDTPQGALRNVEDMSYLTNGSVNGSESSSMNAQVSDNEGEQNDGTQTLTSKINNNKSSNDNETNVATAGHNEGETESDESTIGNKNKKENKEGESSRNDTSASNSKQNITNFNSYLEKLTGKRSTTSYSKLLMEFRDTFLNIDMMIIRELEDLFMGVW